MKKIKRKNPITAVGYALFALIVTIALFLTASMGYSKLTHRRQELFGYAVNVAAENVAGTKIQKGDAALTKYVKTDKISVGDVIVYYAHADGSPAGKNDDRSDVKIAFGKVEGVDINRYTVDGLRVSYESVAGVAVETPEIVALLLKWIIGEYAWVCWCGLILLILLIGGLVKLGKYEKKRSVVKKITTGKIGLFDQQCFQSEVFSVIRKKERTELYGQCRGTELILDCLSDGKPCQGNPNETAELFAGKRCTLKDALAVTCSKEPPSKIETDEYINALPTVKRGYVGYEDASDVYQKRCGARIAFWGVTVGILIFFAAVIAVEFLTERFVSVSLYERILIFAVPAAVFIAALFHTLLTTGRDNLVDKYFAFDTNLPGRYDVFLKGGEMTNEQIVHSLDEIADALRGFGFDEHEIKIVKYKLPEQPTDALARESERLSQNIEDIHLSEQPADALARESERLARDIEDIHLRYDGLVSQLLERKAGEIPDGTKPGSEVVIAEAAATGDEMVPAFAAKAKQSYAEALEMLSVEQKEMYRQLKAYAENLPNTKTAVSTSGERIKIRAKQLVQFRIRRETLTAVFDFESDEVRTFRLQQRGVVKPQPTIVRVIDETALATAKRMVDLMAEQIEREEEDRKVARRAARKAKQLAKNTDSAPENGEK